MRIVQVRPEHLSDWLQSVSARSDVEHAPGAPAQLLATMLDVREPWECQAASVLGAQTFPKGMRLLQIPMHELQARRREIPNDEPVAVLCHHGTRSLHVAQWLAGNGFDDVANVQGGIDAWARDFDPSIAIY